MVRRMSSRTVFATPVAEVAPLRPAATVVLLRDSPDGPEVWLMERSRNVGFMAAAWVFPGGRVDAADAESAATHEGTEAVARSFWTAAARELEEEAGVSLRAGERWDLDAMRVWAHWVTPEIEPRRYDTWFFVARLPKGQEPRADGQEAAQGAWFRPREATEQAGRGELALAPPTLRTLLELADYPSVEAVLAANRHTPPICPRFAQDDEGTLFVLLPGDPDHPSPDRVEPPHRYAFAAGRWWAHPA
jgi:8-oxo-dGTP pyrophosphatase MutT (NUDIX family)